MMTESTRSQPDWAHLIVTSYRSVTGEEMCGASDLLAYSGAVLCHDTSPDPRLVYVNLAAQQLWGRDWGEFVGQPSWITVAPEHRADRAEHLAAPGLVRGYSGERITAAGHRFEIVDALIWPVYAASDSHDSPQERVGQAAAFREWRLLS